jgi:hypothetical protein
MKNATGVYDLAVSANTGGVVTVLASAAYA